MITLTRGPDTWTAEYSGPIAAKIAAIFGTTRIATAYRRSMPAWEVRDRVAATNPGQTVVVAPREPQHSN